MKTEHVKLEVTLISNIVTIKTIHLSEEVTYYFKNHPTFTHSITIMSDRTTKFDEISLHLGYNDSNDRIGYFSFTSDRRAKRFLAEMNESLSKLAQFINSDNTFEFEEGKRELVF